MLVVVGDDLEPDLVSDALDREPDQSWRRGERWSVTFPDGTARQYDGVYDRGVWKKFIPDQYRDKPLFDQVFLWLARLRELGDEIASLRERGWEPELNCRTGTGEVLVLLNHDPRRLADLGLDLGLEISLSRSDEGDGGNGLPPRTPHFSEN